MTGKIRVHTSLCDGRLIGNGNLPDNKGTWKLFIKIDGEEPEWFIVCVSHMIRKTGGNPLALTHVLKNATFCFPPFFFWIVMRRRKFCRRVKIMPFFFLLFFAVLKFGQSWKGQKQTRKNRVSSCSLSFWTNCKGILYRELQPVNESWVKIYPNHFFISPILSCIKINAWKIIWSNI